MAIQLGNFKPLEHKHYTLAKTQSEYDEDAKRQMAIDNNRAANEAVMQTMQEQNANNRANAAIMEGRRKDATQQANTEFEQSRQLGLDQASLDQQAIDNEYRDRAFSANQAGIDANNRRANAQLGLNQAQEAREQQAYNQALQEREQKIALAKFGNRLLSSDPDEKGRIDISDSFDTVNTLVGGGLTKEQFKKVYAQNTGDKTILLGEDKDGKPIQLTRSGSPVVMSNELLKTIGMFGGDEDYKTQEAKAKAEKARLEVESLKDPIERKITNDGNMTIYDKRTGTFKTVSIGLDGQPVISEINLLEAQKPQMSDEEKLKAFATLFGNAQKK